MKICLGTKHRGVYSVRYYCMGIKRICNFTKTIAIPNNKSNALISYFRKTKSASAQIFLLISIVPNNKLYRRVANSSPIGLLVYRSWVQKSYEEDRSDSTAFTTCNRPSQDGLVSPRRVACAYIVGEHHFWQS